MLGLGGGLSNQILLEEEFVDPNSVSDIAVWLKNTSAVAAAGWSDSSTNENDITQSVSANQGIADGSGGLVLDGTNDHYDFDSAIPLG